MRTLGLSLALLALAGCAAPDTALQLVREQQQIQRAAQDYEARSRADAATGEDIVHLSTIRRLQDEGRHFAALAHLDAHQNRFGDSPEVAVLRANALRATGQREASVQAYQALLNGPQAAAAWHGLGLLAAAEGDFGQATQALARAAAMAPTDVDVLGDLGYARLRAGDRRGARVPLAQAAELAPDNLKAVANLALLMVAEGNVDGGEAIMQRAGLGEATREAVRRQGKELAAVPLWVAARTQPAAASGRAPANASVQTAATTPSPGPTPAAVAAAAGGRVPVIGTAPAGEAASPQAPSAAGVARPVVMAVPASPGTPPAGAASGAVAPSNPTAVVVGAAGSAPAAPGAAVQPSARQPSPSAPSIDMYAAPTQSLLDRFAAGGSTLH